jgi:hypothetical protein
VLPKAAPGAARRSLGMSRCGRRLRSPPLRGSVIVAGANAGIGFPNTLWMSILLANFRDLAFFNQSR